MSDENSGLEQARRARERAEQEYADAVAQRPEVKEVAMAAVRLRRENHFAELVIQAMKRRPA